MGERVQLCQVGDGAWLQAETSVPSSLCALGVTVTSLLATMLHQGSGPRSGFDVALETLIWGSEFQACYLSSFDGSEKLASLFQG